MMVVLNKKTISALLSCLMVSGSAPNLLANTQQKWYSESKSSICNKDKTKTLTCEEKIKIFNDLVKCVICGGIAYGAISDAYSAYKKHNLDFTPEEKTHQKSDSVCWFEACYYARNREERNIAKSKYVDTVWHSIRDDLSNYHDSVGKFIETIITQDCKFMKNNTLGNDKSKKYVLKDVLFHTVKSIYEIEDPSVSMCTRDFCKSDNAEIKFKNIMRTVIDNMLKYKIRTVNEVTQSVNKIMKDDKIAKTNGEDTIDKVFADIENLRKNFEYNLGPKAPINSHLYEIMNLKNRIKKLLTDSMFRSKFEELCNELENYNSSCAELRIKRLNSMKEITDPIVVEFPKDEEKISEIESNIWLISKSMESQIKTYDHKSKLVGIIDNFQKLYMEIVRMKNNY